MIKAVSDADKYYITCPKRPYHELRKTVSHADKGIIRTQWQGGGDATTGKTGLKTHNTLIFNNIS